MAMPALRPLAAACYQQLRLLAPDDEALGWPLLHFVAAKIGPLEDIAEWTSDTDAGPGYSILLDIDRCPAIALPWLAQFKGVEIPPGLTEDEQRAWVRSAEGQHRGTVDALKRAGQRHLTGTKSVRVLERVGGNAYDITCITRTSETPDPVTTKADLTAAKRIGIRLTHIVSDEPIYDEATRTIDAATNPYDSATVADVT
jgi:hypothetical protein